MTSLREGTLVNITSNCVEGLRGKLWGGGEMGKEEKPGLPLCYGSQHGVNSCDYRWNTVFKKCLPNGRAFIICLKNWSNAMFTFIK